MTKLELADYITTVSKRANLSLHKYLDNKIQRQGIKENSKASVLRLYGELRAATLELIKIVKGKSSWQ